MTNQGRRWCFTLNNYSEEEEKRIQGVYDEYPGVVRFIIYGRETGESGTKHLQGYLELRKHRRLNGVKTLLGTERLHLEVAVGSAEQNVTYCSKEDPSPFSRGSRADKEQGARNDLRDVSKAIKRGASALEIFGDYGEAFLKYHRGIERAIELVAPPRSHATQFIWRYGFTGSGKSRDTLAESNSMCNGYVQYVSDVSCKWFNGIMPNCRGVVLDEFNGKVELSYLLRMLDRYPFKVPYKGGFVEWSPRIVWITSQFSPRYYYGGDDQWLALVRRIRDFGVVLEYDRDSSKKEFSREHWDEVLNTESNVNWDMQ